jgi:hypothetical protein
MSVFFTKIDIPVPGFTIDYRSKLLFLGSCFVENIGKKMNELKFDTCMNPFGVLYNPVSLAKSIILLLEKPSFQKSDLSFYNELWYSYAHYTFFSDVNPDRCLEKINERFIKAHDFIQNADIVFITLGTSWIFKLKETGKVVANCHKLPSTNFDREFSSIENSCEQLKESVNHLRKINPHVKFIFTVSPIRHFKDGAVENQRSKAALILTIAKLQRECQGIYYFPAYEIFMDELRDYRFYAEDMIHPSEVATEYIWDRFSSTLLNETSSAIASEILKLNLAMNHRPNHIDTNSYKRFVETVIKKIDALSGQFPFLDFTQERKSLEQISLKFKE